MKEFASQSIEHRTEKRLNVLTVCPSWEEGTLKKSKTAQNAYRSTVVRNIVTRSETEITKQSERRSQLAAKGDFEQTGASVA